MLLAMGKRIHGCTWTELPVGDDTIKMMKDMADNKNQDNEQVYEVTDNDTINHDKKDDETTRTNTSEGSRIVDINDDDNRDEQPNDTVEDTYND